MTYRVGSAEHPVTIWHDGDEIVAERGQSLAVALLGAGRVALARSPKLHRPRGPYCLRGACDGCLARVDGVPNVMLCMTEARGNERIETQNVLGSRGLDVMGAADFLFPHGIDHHRLLAGVRGASSIVQSFARQVAGLGRLPERPESPNPARRDSIDVLVVGGGLAGLSAAAAVGERAALVDDGIDLGGSLRALAPERARQLAETAAARGARLLTHTAALGLYREPNDGGRLHALLAGPLGAALVDARVVLLAPGSHDPAPFFPNNDLPGVMSARAALLLWHAGVAPAKRVAIVGSGRFASRFRELATGTRAVEIASGHVLRASGRSHVVALIVRDGERKRRMRVGAALIDGPAPPCFELAVQAGASVRFDSSGGYVVKLDAERRAAPNVFCAGSGSRAPGESGDSEAEGRCAAQSALSDLART